MPAHRLFRLSGLACLGFMLLGPIALVSAHSAPAQLTFASVSEAESYLKKNRRCPGCNLRNAELSYADLQRADLQNADLKGADLNHADLRGANLRGATLIRADLSTATRLEGADLRDSNMREANIRNSELKLSLTCGAILPDGSKAEECPETSKGRRP